VETAALLLRGVLADTEPKERPDHMTGRIRSIKPEWLEDESMIALSAEARVVSVGLLLLADDHGNGRGSEPFLSARIFPFAESLETLRNGLAELQNIGFVELYRLRGQTYFSIRNWKKHQRVDKPGKPRVPGPLDDGVEKVPGTLAKIPGGLAPDPDPDPDLGPRPRSRITDQDPITVAPQRIADAAEREISTRDEEPTPIAQVRGAFLSAYAARYPQASRYPWGAREGGAAKNWLKSVPLDEALSLVTWFFAWKRPEVIKAGHPFCTGAQSLILKFHELRADLAHPERRAFAAAVTGDEKQATHEAEGAAQQRRVLAKLTEKKHAIGSGESGGSLGANTNAVRGVQPASLGLVARGMGGLAVANARAGADLVAEARVQATAHAGSGGHHGGDDGGEEAER
jgi:hypothetical protein